MAAGLAMVKEAAAQTVAPTPEPQRLVTQLWSRHLQWVSTQADAQSNPESVGILIGQALGQSGYAAVDLTVRADGHVLPQNVATVPAFDAQGGIRSTGAICDQHRCSISRRRPIRTNTSMDRGSSSCMRYCRWLPPTASRSTVCQQMPTAASFAPPTRNGRTP